MSAEFRSNLELCGQAEHLEGVRVLPVGDEFREEIGFGGIQEKFGQAFVQSAPEPVPAAPARMKWFAANKICGQTTNRVRINAIFLPLTIIPLSSSEKFGQAAPPQERNPKPERAES